MYVCCMYPRTRLALTHIDNDDPEKAIALFSRAIYLCPNGMYVFL